MDLQLVRADILQVEPISHRGTLKLLPPGKKNKQKLLIGDDSGQVSCFEFKKGEPQMVFQVKLFDGKIACVALGGPVSKQDRLFVAHGQHVIGLTKKGKEFFKLASEYTENIHNMFVDDTLLWVGYEYIHNMYNNAKSTSYYSSRDLINAFSCERIVKSTSYDAILGCQDDCIRIVQGSKLVLEIPTLGPVKAIYPFVIEDSRQNNNNVNLLYGTQNGVISIVYIEPGGTCFSHGWCIDDKKSVVTCVQAFDLTKNGSLEIIVTRDDGSIEVYGFENGMDKAPSLLFCEDVGESIQSLQCGLVNSSDFNEIVVASYSGKIISFTAEPILQRAQDDTYGRSVQTVNNENRIKHLRKEVETLRAKLEKDKSKVTKVNVQSVMKPPPDFPVNSGFVLDADLAAYALSVELQTPIDLIVLRSPVFLEFTDTGNALVSVTPSHLLQPSASVGSDEMGYKFMAAFRCQNTQDRRVNITIRTTEGEAGELVATIVAASSPKAAKVVKFSLKPLSLHSKVHILSEEQLSRPRNRIKFSGQVPLKTLHEWVKSIFPDVPPVFDEDVTSESYRFKHTFTSAVTLCDMKSNEVVFESESASTIAIIKENVTRLANYHRFHLEENLACDDKSILSFLTLIKPKLTHQISLARKMDIVDAVQEIAMQDQSSSSWLSPEFSEILANQESIRSEFKMRAKSLEYLSGIITDLFVDWNRLRGQDVRNRIGVMQQVLLSNDFDKLVETILSAAKPAGGGAQLSRKF